jgi:hypothetical protein
MLTSAAPTMLRPSCGERAPQFRLPLMLWTCSERVHVYVEPLKSKYLNFRLRMYSVHQKAQKENHPPSLGSPE